jgi:hypothetical protein
MIKLIVGFALGFYVATIGVTGVATAIDIAVDKVKSTSVSVETK